jgi:hypothetical protein
MSIAEQADQQPVEHMVLAYDHPGRFVPETVYK